MQQSFSGSLKVPSIPCLLSIYEGLITNWEEKKKNSVYSSIHQALDAGIALLGKYYSATDESPLAVLSTGISPILSTWLMLIKLQLVLDLTMKDSYINHYFTPQQQVLAMENVHDLVSIKILWLSIWAITEYCTLSFSSIVVFISPKQSKMVVQQRNAHMSPWPLKPLPKPLAYHTTSQLVKLIMHKRFKAVTLAWSWTTISVIPLNSLGSICFAFGWWVSHFYFNNIINCQLYTRTKVLYIPY